jgi:hypothetical protein
MRGSFWWQTRKDTIHFKDFGEWAHNQAIFRVFLQKEAVKEIRILNPKTNTILNYFWEGKEEDMGEEYNSSGAHRTGGIIFASTVILSRHLQLLCRW